MFVFSLTLTEHHEGEVEILDSSRDDGSETLEFVFSRLCRVDVVDVDRLSVLELVD